MSDFGEIKDRRTREILEGWERERVEKEAKRKRRPRQGALNIRRQPTDEGGITRQRPPIPKAARRIFRALERNGCQPRWVEGFRAIEAICPCCRRDGKPDVPLYVRWPEGGRGWIDVGPSPC